jgi:surface protein
MTWFGGEVGGRESALELETISITGCTLGMKGVVKIDWGDGNITYRNDPSTGLLDNDDDYPFHSYSTSDKYKIKIYGDVDFLSTRNPASTRSFSDDFVDKIVNWGDIQWVGEGHRILFLVGISARTDIISLLGSNVTQIPSYPPDIRGITNMQSAFSANNTLTLTDMSGLVDLDLTEVESLDEMFYLNNTFNEPIGAWNTSNVSNMFAMFSGASAFNQDIGSWDVSNVTNMTSLFASAAAFNQDIGSWDVSNPGNTNFYRVFYDTDSFNQDIGSWDVSNVTNMSQMFWAAYAFDQNIGSWNVSNVTDMSLMFRSAIFNQDIGSWNVSNVTNMRQMFYLASSFNQDIGSWDVSNVTNMSSLFQDASSFNQDISSWYPGIPSSSFSSFLNMLNNTNMSVENYSKWLICLANWANDNFYTSGRLGATGLQYNNITYSGIGSGVYTDAVSARAYLVTTLGWSISDSGQAP